MYDELTNSYYCHVPHYDSGPGGDCLEQAFIKDFLPEFADLMDIGFDEEDLDPENDYNPYNRKVYEDDLEI